MKGYHKNYKELKDKRCPSDVRRVNKNSEHVLTKVSNLTKGRR